MKIIDCSLIFFLYVIVVNVNKNTSIKSYVFDQKRGQVYYFEAIKVGIILLLILLTTITALYCFTFCWRVKRVTGLAIRVLTKKTRQVFGHNRRSLLFQGIFSAFSRVFCLERYSFRSIFFNISTQYLKDMSFSEIFYAPNCFFFSWDLIFAFCHFLQFWGKKSMFVPPIFFFTKTVF